MSSPHTDASTTPTHSPGIGGLMWLFALPSAFSAFVFLARSQRSHDDAGWSIGAGVFAVLVTVWLLLAGLALVRLRPPASLRVPGFVAIAAAAVGVLVFLPGSFRNPYATESADWSRIFLPATLTALLGGLGHVFAAHNKAGAARTLHWIAPLGFVGSIGVVLLYVFRVVR